MTSGPDVAGTDEDRVVPVSAEGVAAAEGAEGAVSAEGADGVDGVDGAGPPVRPAPRRWRALPYLVVAVGVWFGTQVSMLVFRDDFDLHQFRGYFPYDQLSYLSIVVEGSQGRFDLVEPFTRTGLNYYPHLYYLFLGAVSWVTGVGPLVTWTVVGLALQVVLVVSVGLSCVRFSGRPWTAVLGVVPLVIGTFASVSGEGWFTVLDRHAVLWGAYGVFFPLNGGVAGLVLGSLGLLALASVAVRPLDTGRPLARAMVGAGVIGLVGDVQTYTFLAATFLAFYVAATYGLVVRRARVSAVVSVVLLVVLFLVGGALHDTLGALPVLVLGLTPALPGMLALYRVVGPRLLLPIATLALVAAPQVLWTVRGIATGDPFLLYRQDSTSDLGVPLLDFVRAGSIVIVLLLGILAAGLYRRHPLWTAYPVGAAVAWFLVAGNDRWGAEQEPYRLWIDGFALLGFVSMPIAAAAAASVLGRRRYAGTADVAAPARPRASRAATTVGAAWLVVVLGMGTASIGDWWGFWQTTHEQGFLSYYGPREDALRAALAGRGDDLVLPDTCIDPFDVKIATAGRVAFYNVGMAWPDHEPALGLVMAARLKKASLDVTEARNAGVQVVVTSSGCPDAWPQRYATDLTALSSAGYTNEGVTTTFTVWRMNP